MGFSNIAHGIMCMRIYLQTSTGNSGNKWNLGGLEVEDLDGREDDHHGNQKHNQCLENLAQVVLWKGSGTDGSDQWHDSLVHSDACEVEGCLCQEETNGCSCNLLVLDEGLEVHEKLVLENE